MVDAGRLSVCCCEGEENSTDSERANQVRFDVNSPLFTFIVNG